MRTPTLALTLALAQVCLADELHVPDDFATIQDAIDAANDGDEVVVAPGVYSEILDLLGKEITLRSSAGPDQTTLDGLGLDESILVALSGETLSTRIAGFTFLNGEGSLLPNCVGNKPVGGAIYIGPASAVSVQDCSFIDNGVDRDIVEGAAIYIHGGSLDVADCLFSGNGQFTVDEELGAAFGGAIGSCIFFPKNSITIARSQFIDNYASFGAGVRAEGADLFMCTDSTFTNNESAHGAGITANMEDDTVFEVSRCSFDQNVASHGAGIQVFSSSQVTIADCDFTAGQASFGAGINLSQDYTEAGTPSIATVRGCRFVDNHAGFGGGLTVAASVGTLDEVDWPEVTLLDCEFVGNIADGCCDTGVWHTECFRDGVTNGRFFGGAGDIRTLYGGRVNIINCLAYGNDATLAGGFHLGTCGGGEINLINTTVADNAPSGVHVREGFAPSQQEPANVLIANTITASNGDLDEDQLITEIDDHPDIGFEARYNLIPGGFDGEGNIDADPDFTNPSVGDYTLASGSAGIDAGDNAMVPDGVETDLGGADRFVDDPSTDDTGLGSAPIVDTGAHEFQPGSCPADLDGDGDADAEDFFAYLDLFASGDLGADIDGDGDLDAEDFFGYLDLFTQAC